MFIILVLIIVVDDILGINKYLMKKTIKYKIFLGLLKKSGTNETRPRKIASNLQM